MEPEVRYEFKLCLSVSWQSSLAVKYTSVLWLTSRGAQFYILQSCCMQKLEFLNYEWVGNWCLFITFREYSQGKKCLWNLPRRQRRIPLDCVWGLFSIHCRGKKGKTSLILKADKSLRFASQRRDSSSRTLEMIKVSRSIRRRTFFPHSECDC